MSGIEKFALLAWGLLIAGAGVFVLVLLPFWCLARWARARGRRPWAWVLGVYAAINLVWGLVAGAMR